MEVGAAYLLEKLASLLSFDTVLVLMAILLSFSPVLPHDRQLACSDNNLAIAQHCHTEQCQMISGSETTQ